MWGTMNEEMFQHTPTIIVSDDMFQGIESQRCSRTLDVVWDEFGKRLREHDVGLVIFRTVWTGYMRGKMVKQRIGWINLVEVR